jgi:hypothetical protein
LLHEVASALDVDGLEQQNDPRTPESYLYCTTIAPDRLRVTRNRNTNQLIAARLIVAASRTSQFLSSSALLLLAACQ